MKEFDHDKISRYLDGEMNADETSAFEEQIQMDIDLQKEVELTREVNEILKIKMNTDENEIALLNTLEEFRGKYFAGKDSSEKIKVKIVSFSRTRWISAVAAVLIMVVMLTIWQPWQKNLYEQYASTQMPAITERGESSDSLLKKATLFFNDKKFSSAILLFESILKTDSQNAFVKYYFGIALLQNGQVENSRAALMEMYNGVSMFRYDAAFYVALGYLKEKNKTTCKEWLNKVPADAGVYNKAQELMKKL